LVGVCLWRCWLNRWGRRALAAFGRRLHSRRRREESRKFLALRRAHIARIHFFTTQERQHIAESGIAHAQHQVANRTTFLENGRWRFFSGQLLKHADIFLFRRFFRDGIRRWRSADWASPGLLD